MQKLKLLWNVFALVIMTVAGALGCADAQAQNVPIRVRGQIVDQSGQPIIGAAVVVAGTTQGTVTDIDGNYELKVAPDATL